MRTMTTTEAARSIGRTCLQAQASPIKLTARGEPVAVLVGASAWQAIEAKLKEAEFSFQVFLRGLKE